MEPTFGENAYILSVPDSGDGRIGWVIDPSFPPQTERLLDYLAEQSIVLEKIILTHGHIDHIIGVDAIREAHPQATILLAEPDQPMLQNADLNMSAPFGMPLAIQSRADGDLVPDAELTLGELRWRVLDTSGHSPGGRSLHCPAERAVFVGDALFAGSVGRCDIPGSDYHRLIGNIHKHIMTLPSDTRIYSGHGPKTSVANQRKSNPFLSDA